MGVSVSDAVPPAPSCRTPEQSPSGQGKAAEERGHRAGAGLDSGRAPGAFGPRRRWLRAPYVTAAGPWWGRGTETGGRGAPQNQKRPGADAGCPPLVEAGGIYKATGCAGPCSGQLRAPPRCAAGQDPATGAGPRGGSCLQPGSRRDLPWGRGSEPPPLPPQNLSTLRCGGSLGNPRFWREAGIKHGGRGALKKKKKRKPPSPRGVPAAPVRPSPS